jgi:transposase
MKYFAGLDVSLEETAICVVDLAGTIVKETRAASEPNALAAALRSLDLALERIDLESCALTAWLHDELRAGGWPVVCIETRQAKAATGAMPNKTDCRAGSAARDRCQIRHAEPEGFCRAGA